MDKLKRLMALCKCGVFVSVNEHRDYYENVDEFIVDRNRGLEGIDKDVFSKMTETDTVIQIQFYPETPIGSYSVFHYDLEMALNEALECLAYKVAPNKVSDETKDGK